MIKKNVTGDLNFAICELENKQALELMLLKEQFMVTYESLKPINLIKSTFREVTASPGINSNILGTTIGLASGYLSKKVLFGASHNPIKRVIGTLLQYAIANVVSKNADTIISAGENMMNRIWKSRKEENPDFHNNGNS